MITAPETFANYLRGGASLIRITHGAGCPDEAAHHAAAAVLEAAAETVEAGGSLPQSELTRVETIARTYRTAMESVEVPA